MRVERSPTAASLADVVDRVLDKGIVIDAYLRVSVAGIDLVSVDALVLVASVEKYLSRADAVRSVRLMSRPLFEDATPARLRMEHEEAELHSCPTVESGEPERKG